MDRRDALRLILLAVLLASLGVAAATVGLAVQGEGSGSASVPPADGLEVFDASKESGSGSANAVTDAVEDFLATKQSGSGQAATGALDGFLAAQGDGSSQASTGTLDGFLASKGGGTGSSPP